MEVKGKGKGYEGNYDSNYKFKDKRKAMVMMRVGTVDGVWM